MNCCTLGGGGGSRGNRPSTPGLSSFVGVEPGAVQLRVAVADRIELCVVEGVALHPPPDQLGELGGAEDLSVVAGGVAEFAEEVPARSGGVLQAGGDDAEFLGDVDVVDGVAQRVPLRLRLVAAKKAVDVGGGHPWSALAHDRELVRGSEWAFRLTPSPPTRRRT